MYLNQSDKNLDSLFTDLIRVLSKYPKLKVVLLIDEIETLVRSRQYLISSTSSNSSVQLVNTMLICLDRVRHFPNLTIFTTSNLIESLDLAFLDRVDAVLNIKEPDAECCYKIIVSNLMKLKNQEVVVLSEIDATKPFESFKWCDSQSNDQNSNASMLCYKLAVVCAKLEVSGRFLNKGCFSCTAGQTRVSLNWFLQNLLQMVVSKKQAVLS
ncbi:unnamed protein product [Ambrosiozyma monospora]|uniref:Unnamed protein product n=1 Tax=Ambrosiozyma monospora TaxID=43982 RepID=A0ACB5T4R9_AMBMO|nr:unnamed protein product [Ambrosiozyma monospora]